MEGKQGEKAHDDNLEMVRAEPGQTKLQAKTAEPPVTNSLSNIVLEVVKGTRISGAFPSSEQGLQDSGMGSVEQRT